jgi:hypothetical protein
MQMRSSISLLRDIWTNLSNRSRKLLTASRPLSLSQDPSSRGAERLTRTGDIAAGRLDAARLTANFAGTHPPCIEAVRRAADAGHGSRDIASGAGHDSAHVARRLRHNEAEHPEKRDVVAGAKVVLRAVLEPDQRLTDPVAGAA